MYLSLVGDREQFGMKPKRQTPNQIVAQHMIELRTQRDQGWTQQHLAKQLSVASGEQWTIGRVSDAEAARVEPEGEVASGGLRANRPRRRFTLLDVLALAQVFRVPVHSLLLPARGTEVHMPSNLVLSREQYARRVLGFPLDEDELNHMDEAFENMREKQLERMVAQAGRTSIKSLEREIESDYGAGALDKFRRLKLPDQPDHLLSPQQSRFYHDLIGELPWPSWPEPEEAVASEEE